MKDLINKIKTKFSQKQVEKFDIIFFIILALIVFIFTTYADIQYTVTHTLNYISAIMKGNIFDLYKANYLVTINGNLTSVCYDAPIYIIFAIWNFPLWIIQNLFKVDVIHNFFCLIWIKTLLLVFLYGSMKVIKEICKEIKIDKKYYNWISLIFVSSPLVFSSLYYMSQYDIIAIFFTLLGILAYVKKNFKKFIFWFMIAIPLKMFPLFIFIPLILLYEKKIFNIGITLLKGCSLLLLTKVIQQFMPMYKESVESFNSSMFSYLVDYSSVKVSSGIASVFIIVYAFICLYCYLKELKTNEERYKYAIYIPFVTYVTLFLLIMAHPYWLIYITPFFTIMLFQNPKFFKANLLLDMVMEFSIIVVQTIMFSWCFSIQQLKDMFLSLFIANKEAISLKYSNLLSLYDGKVDSLRLIFCSFFVFAVIALIIINYPKKDNGTIKIERSVIWMRMLIFIPFLILLLYCYLV